MIAKCGPIVAWHWAHAVGGDCEPWSEPESAWHLAWKERFVDAGCQVEVPIVRDGERHRADVVLPGGRVVELQHGYLKPDAIWEREAFYRDVVWLYDADRFWDRSSSATGRSSGCTRRSRCSCTNGRVCGTPATRSGWSSGSGRIAAEPSAEWRVGSAPPNCPGEWSRQSSDRGQRDNRGRFHRP
jgi:hypothetical protein